MKAEQTHLFNGFCREATTMNHYSLRTEFFNAIKKGDINYIIQLLSDETSNSVINTENEEGKTALQVALETHNYGK